MKQLNDIIYQNEMLKKQTEIVKDDFGVDIRRLPTISGRSYWTNKCGFVGTKKQAQAFIFNENEGLTDLININILD